MVQTLEIEMDEKSPETPVLVEVPDTEVPPGEVPATEPAPADPMEAVKSIAIEVPQGEVPPGEPAATVAVSTEDGSPLFTVEFYAGSAALLVAIVLAAVFKLRTKIQ